MKIESFHGFLGKNPPTEKTHIANGIFENADGTYSHHSGTKQTNFKDLEAAEIYAEARRSKYKKDLIAADSEMKNNYNISDEDKSAFGQYANNLGGLNHKLVNNEPLSEKEHGFVSNLDKSIGNYKAHDDLVVYTGTNEAHAKKLREGGVVSHPSYISTSVSPSAARAFATQKGGDIVKVHVPKGHPGVYLHGVSNYEGEREFVLPRNTKLQIHPDKEETLIHDDKYYRVHHATIVPKEPGQE